MARNSIIEKLGRELSGEFPIRRESQVVYVMAEIRKVIEHEREYDGHCYEVLELFCHWVLHIAVDRRTNADRIRLFLRAFDLRDGMEIGDFLKSGFYNNIMQLEAFRGALDQFLVDHGLPADTVHSFRSWSGFVYLYTSVVAEVPLRYSKADLLPDEIEELIIRHVRDPQSEINMVNWVMKLKDGQERSAMTRYGVYRNSKKHVTALPDFHLVPGFQLQ
jgi:hypothetical protein